MTSSTEANVELMRDEYKMYCRLTRDLYRCPSDDPELDLVRDELELLRDMTEWPAMRQRCVDALNADDLFRLRARRA